MAKIQIEDDGTYVQIDQVSIEESPFFPPFFCLKATHGLPCLFTGRAEAEA